MKVRSVANGSVVELSDEAAAVLVPVIYEPIDERSEEPKWDSEGTLPRAPDSAVSVAENKTPGVSDLASISASPKRGRPRKE